MGRVPRPGQLAGRQQQQVLGVATHAGAEAFSGYLPAGTYTWDYIARATTPGTFVVPPATAEEIYTPEVFGRTGTDTVVVEG